MFFRERPFFHDRKPVETRMFVQNYFLSSTVLKGNWLFCWLIVVIFLTGGCVPTSKLAEHEYLLYNQKVVKNKSIASEDFEVYYRQKPNRRILYLPFMPYLYAYYLGKQRYERNLPKDSVKLERLTEKYAQRTDWHLQKLLQIKETYAQVENPPKSYHRDTLSAIRKLQRVQNKGNDRINSLIEKMEEGNWLMRYVGENPVIYDSVATSATLDQMNKYLKYRGFFDGKVDAMVDTMGKLVRVRYVVEENTPYRIREVQFQTPDLTMEALLGQYRSKSYLKKGEIYNEANIEKERARVNRLMQDNGYFDFSIGSIFFRVNDTIPNYELDVTIHIRNPSRERQYKQFFIRNVTFESDVDFNGQVYSDTLFRKIRYLQGDDRYSAKVLDSKIFIRPDSTLYRISDSERTQLALARLDMFRFVNVRYDTTDQWLNAYLYTSSLRKYQYSLEGGLNVSQSLPGPFVSVSFKNRNVFGGGDILEIRLRAAIEAQAGATEQQNFQSQEYGGNITLTFPRILFPIRSTFKRKFAYSNPVTQLQGGFSYVSRPEYTRTNIQSAINYRWANRNEGTFNFSLLDLSIINTTRLDSAFRQRLDTLAANGNTLINSFDRSLVSSMIFSYQKSNVFTKQETNKTSFIKFTFETGGTTMNLFGNRLLTDGEKLLGLRYFRYLKGLFDVRYGFPISKHSSFAARASAGVASPYRGGDVLPYEKYFFSGGSNSNRAWPARRVGPGSFSPRRLENGQLDFSFEQPGDILLEGNVEWRRDLFSFFEGALFIDATNVWTIRNDRTRPGSQFSTDFWREIAIGTGFGLRLDFEFLIVRFDLGIKAYNPALPQGERWVLDNLSFRRPLGEPGQFTFNLGIGYPF
jgi:outer membrane protein assembly factor BamA